MKAYVRFVIGATVATPLAVGGVFAMKLPEAMAKTSMVYCGSPGKCEAYPYKPHGGHGGVCDQHSPCYMSPGCTGDDVCGSERAPQPN